MFLGFKLLISWILKVMLLGLLKDYVTPTSALVGLVCGLLVYQLTKKRYKLPPAPFEWPLIGNIEVMTSQFWFLKLIEYAKLLGPVFRVSIGPHKVVVLNDLKAAQEALITKSGDFADRPCTTLLDELSEGRKDIALANYTPAWKLHRKLASKAFRQYLTGDHLDKILNAALSEVVLEMKKETQLFDPQRLIDFGVFNISCLFCFNTRFELKDPVMATLMKANFVTNDISGNGVFEDIFPYFRHIFRTQAYKDAINACNILLEFCKMQVEKHQKSLNPSNIRDLTDNLIIARQEAEAEEDAQQLASITNVHIRQTILDLLSGGIETTRTTLLWAVLYMAAFPEIQKKCQEQIDSVVASDRLPSVKDKSNLPFVDVTLHEIMRIRPVGPIGLPHAARIDSTIGEYEIPKGMSVLINHYALHMNPDYWPEPEKFDPHRFLDEDGKLTQKPEAWLPFSAGRRVCLGETIAKSELVVIMSTLLQQFSISLPSGYIADLSFHGSTNILRPKEFKICVKPRM